MENLFFFFKTILILTVSIGSYILAVITVVGDTGAGPTVGVNVAQPLPNPAIDDAPAGDTLKSPGQMIAMDRATSIQEQTFCAPEFHQAKTTSTLLQKVIKPTRTAGARSSIK